MKRHWIIFGALALVVFWSGCKKLEFMPSEPNAIMPLEKGRYWVYEEVFSAIYSDSVRTDCINRVEWEVLEKGYLDVEADESSGEDVRMEMFSMRSKRGSDNVYYLLRPESDGIMIHDITGKNPSPNARSPVEPCHGVWLSDKKYMIQYPFPDSTELPQNIITGCSDFSCVEELLVAAQSNGPRKLVPAGMTSVDVGGESIDAMQLGSEYWAPEVGLVKIDWEWFLAWQTDTVFYELSWELKEYGTR